MSETIHCIVVDDEPVACEILETHLSKIAAIKVIATCKNAVEAFNIINKNKIDLIFLDINMPEVTGLSFAKLVTGNTKVIFTTAYREYAIDGFNLQAVDYLLKPISFERLLQAVNKYLKENIPYTETTNKEIQEKKANAVFVRSDRKMVKIIFAEIKYIESLGDYIKINLTDKTVMTRETISDFEARLPQKDFLRVHRSFIVAIACIDSFTNETIEIGKKEIPISRTYKQTVIQRLENKN